MDKYPIEDLGDREILLIMLEFLQRLDNRMERLMSDASALGDAVTAEAGAISSVATAISDLQAQIQAGINSGDPAAIQAAVTQLGTQTAQLQQLAAADPGPQPPAPAPAPAPAPTGAAQNLTPEQRAGEAVPGDANAQPQGTNPTQGQQQTP